jgi:hypothetical protein
MMSLATTLGPRPHLSTAHHAFRAITYPLATLNTSRTTKNDNPQTTSVFIAMIDFQKLAHVPLFGTSTSVPSGPGFVAD